VIDDSDPPADRRAQQELGDAFRELARERTAAKNNARRDRRRHVLGRAALAAFTAILLGSGIAIAIRELQSDNGGPISSDPGAPGHSLPLKPTNAVRARSTATDPLGIHRWGLSTYTSERGRQCLIAARVVKGQMSVVSNDRVTPLSKGVPGFCDDLSRNHLIFTVRRYSVANGGDTLLYGQVDREVKRLVLKKPSQPIRKIRLFSDGTFLVVFAGNNPLHGSRFTATISGKPRTYQLG
jgi:hypothetical protein